LTALHRINDFMLVKATFLLIHGLQPLAFVASSHGLLIVQWLELSRIQETTAKTGTNSCKFIVLVFDMLNSF
jgi:hypothetical protein